eukprot:1195341-Prorocentrum_minimum.AAC.2
MSISRCHMEAPNECGTDALTSRRVDDGNDNVAKAVRKYPKAPSGNNSRLVHSRLVEWDGQDEPMQQHSCKYAESRTLHRSLYVTRSRQGLETLKSEEARAAFAAISRWPGHVLDFLFLAEYLRHTKDVVSPRFEPEGLYLKSITSAIMFTDQLTAQKENDPHAFTTPSVEERQKVVSPKQITNTRTVNVDSVYPFRLRCTQALSQSWADIS